MDQQDMVTLVSEELGPREFTKSHADNLLAWQKRNNHSHWKPAKAPKNKPNTNPAIENQTNAPNQGSGTDNTKESDQPS